MLHLGVSKEVDIFISLGCLVDFGAKSWQRRLAHMVECSGSNAYIVFINITSALFLFTEFATAEVRALRHCITCLG